jgi:hypothetical protein
MLDGLIERWARCFQGEPIQILRVFPGMEPAYLVHDFRAVQAGVELSRLEEVLELVEPLFPELGEAPAWAVLRSWQHIFR